MALFVIFLFARRPRAAVALCAVLITSSLFWLGYQATIHRVTPALFVPNDPSYSKTVDYLDVVHMKTYVYMPAFFIGILLAAAVRTGRTLDISDRRKMYAYLFVWYVANSAAMLAPSLWNSYHLFPPELVGVYVVALKILFIASYVLLTLVLHSYSQERKQRAKLNATHESNNNEPAAEQNDNATAEAGHWNLFKGLCRLSFALYISNYLFIRTDFFTSRVIYYATWDAFFKRYGYGILMMLIVAATFHCLFIAPLDHLRRTFFRKLKERSAKKLD